jgi:alpha-D-xyloside xylohydrolase
MLYQKDNRLVFKYDAEEVWIEAWGTDAFRGRATKMNSMPVEDWALQAPTKSDPEISLSEREGSIVNGKVRATISKRGKIIIYDSKGETLLEEYARNRRDLLDPKCSAIEIEAREFRPLPGGDYHLTMRLESVSTKEKIYGMGQYQQDSLNLKGHDLELAHRNSQASVPFGYGLLWNNPGIGRAVLGKNIMSFEAYSTKVLDYWIVAGDTPADIEEAYARATGTVPMMPEYGLGFWQCKLRYQTQEELLGVAREYKARNLPIDLIVIDFFHWPKQGDWKFDATYWPDPGKFHEATSPPSRANFPQKRVWSRNFKK